MRLIFRNEKEIKKESQSAQTCPKEKERFERRKVGHKQRAIFQEFVEKKKGVFLAFPIERETRKG